MGGWTLSNPPTPWGELILTYPNYEHLTFIRFVIKRHEIDVLPDRILGNITVKCDCILVLLTWAQLR
jgi:hypothetical protein